MSDSAAPVEAQFAPALDARWQIESRPAGKSVRLGLAAAALVHVLLIAVAAGGLDLLLVQVFGLPAISRPAKRAGDAAGVIDGVAAEVIDAAEFDRRYVSFKAGRDVADSKAAVANRSQPPTPQLKPAIDEPLKDGWGDPASPPKPPQTKAPADKTPLTEADVRELLASTMEDLQGGVVAIARPGAARQGEASPFVRAVIRLLKQSMPRSNGIRGSVGIQLVVSLAGTVEAIRVFQSSGRPDLDRLVLERVAATRLVPPAPDTPPRERMFQVTYDYN